MTHHWEALGWTLVHFLWQGAAIALLYRMADLALARGSASARYVLALSTLLGMLAVSLGTLAYEEASYSQPSASLEAARTIVWSTSPVETAASSPAALLPAHDFHITRLMPYLDGLWFTGVLILSFRALGGWWVIRLLRLSRLERAPHRLLLRVDYLRRRMGIRRFVDLRLSNGIVNPLTAGVWRPWILLPVSALTSLSPEQIEVILSHELAHIRRADYFWNILQTVVETIFFFHPAVWWISRRVREERELCCDDIAVEMCSDPTLYAGALLRLEEERKNRLHLAMALDGHQSRAGLRARILRILGDGEEQARPFRPVSLAGIAVALAVFLCPLPKVFANFRSIPQASAAITHTVSSAMGIPIPAPAPRPVPAAHATVRVNTSAPVPAHAAVRAEAHPQAAAASAPAPEPAAPPATPHTDYIDRMRAAGYDVDIDKYVAMKIQGVTPEYAAEMSKAAGHKLTADDLIAMKVQGVSPDYMSQMRGAGYDADVGKYLAMRVQGITPEYADAMAKLGMGKPSADQLIALKVQGVSPDYASKLRADGIEAGSFNELITYRIFSVTPEFAAGMKAAGFGDIPSKKMIELRVQGVTPEFAQGVKAQFPDASVDDLVQMRIFHIDRDFIASAQRHGFAPLTIHKLVKLRISGILDDADEAKESR